MNQDFALSLLALYQQYRAWLNDNPNVRYGVPASGLYGTSIGVDFRGFLLWVEEIYLAEQAE